MLSKTIDKGALYSSMDVRLLEAFRAVVDHRSVTAAACAMGVTQPAVSTQIAKLEEIVGFAERQMEEASVTVPRHQMRCVIVLPPRHPLAAHKLLTPALLSGHPMVAPVRSLQLPPKLQATFAAAGAQLNAVVEAEFLASLCGLVAAGTRWPLVDRLSAESFSHLGLVARPFEPAILYEVAVFHPRHRA